MIDGREVTLEAAIAQAAAILGSSRLPVVAGLATDNAGAEAAVSLARVLGGALDHMHADAALRDLDVMRGRGWIVTTPLQARTMADTLLLVGAGIDAAWPDMAVRLRLDQSPTLAPERMRRVIRLCPGAPLNPLQGATVETIGTDDAPVLLGALRALVAGRPVAPATPYAQDLARCAETLAAAQYGVAIWSAAQLDPLAIEMLSGLVEDLNKSTRFAGLPLPASGNAMGVIQAACWATGLPVRTGFGRASPEHDPWRFDAARLLDSGEADAVLWIAAAATAPLPWQRPVPSVALAAPGTQFAVPPNVVITVGRPGEDHDAILFDTAAGALVSRAAARPATLPRVDQVVRRIAAALPAARSPC